MPETLATEILCAECRMPCDLSDSVVNRHGRRVCPLCVELVRDPEPRQALTEIDWYGREVCRLGCALDSRYFTDARCPFHAEQREREGWQLASLAVPSDRVSDESETEVA